MYIRNTFTHWLMFIIFFFGMVSSAFSKDLGIIETVYPISEPDLLKYMQAQLQEAETNGGLKLFNEQVQNDFKTRMDRPAPLNLSKAQTGRTWSFDTTVKNPRDGSLVNPLDHSTLKETLLFYNADDENQVKWANEINNKVKQNKGCVMLILIGGSVVDQMKQFNERVYFDQGGFITNHFGIKHVPAIVVQQGNHLKIEEVAL